MCFDSEDKLDRKYGALCARQAITELNGAREIEGVELPGNKKLYVSEALKRDARQA